MIKCAILILSDRGSRGEREDLSGKYLLEFLESLGWEVVDYTLLPDEKPLIVSKLKSLCESSKVDLLLTSGGTGVHPRDVTPEATKEVIEREIPGIAEYIRFIGFSKTSLSALSRGLAGVCGQTLIVNLPGSPRALREIMPQLKELLWHAVNKIKGDPSECAKD
ncbi:MAG: MogA/MoaB family molybdenum cofactor biosynthesis protein [Caldimicrobium sp.]|nr:MogA/MoaB family molybdenum cofactor biosynthesis protein [Caldimicrobium sp.]MCX7874142.1 MogA/MoaB family molybdenum cofactor biosynthesis protein [Caldimicrobium sp.]MDW8093723.1 MogA/MoaB family molybdenum cofactor biosynthesis protein [Caldimicrobium sp.]